MSYGPGDWVVATHPGVDNPWTAQILEAHLDRAVLRVSLPPTWRTRYQTNSATVYLDEVRPATPDEIAQACLSGPEDEL